MKKKDKILIWLLLVGIAFYMLNSQYYKTQYLKIKNSKPEKIIIERDVSLIPYDYLGEYTITHYCDCSICTGTPKGSRTASGTKPKEGRTIACDGKILKMGDIVYIENYGTRICEDKGSAITNGRIDIYYNSHEKALKKGIKKARVYKIGG